MLGTIIPGDKGGEGYAKLIERYPALQCKLMNRANNEDIAASAILFIGCMILQAPPPFYIASLMAAWDAVMYRRLLRRAIIAEQDKARQQKKTPNQQR